MHRKRRNGANVLPEIMGRSLQRPGAQEATYRLHVDSDCTSKFSDAVNYHYLHRVTVCIGVQTEWHLGIALMRRCIAPRNVSETWRLLRGVPRCFGKQSGIVTFHLPLCLRPASLIVSCILEGEPTYALPAHLV